MIEGQAAPNIGTDEETESHGDMQAADSKSVDALRRGVAIAFFVTLFISRKLWLTTRDYPLTPVWSWLPQPPYPLDYVLFWVMAAALLAVAFFPNPRGALKVVCGIAILWAMLDQSRWQPYFVLFMVILACLFALPFEKRATWSASQIEWALLPARLLVAFAYMYSGLQKLNHQFVTEIFPWLAGPLRGMIHLDVDRLNMRWVTAMALGAGVGEATAGVLLLFPKTRRPAALFLTAMHGFILLMIGPFGLQWNTVVWPWNIAMIVVLWALFWRRKACSWPTPNLIRRAWWRDVRLQSPILVPAVLFFFGVMPIFSFIGWWDSYLSFSLYSGNTCWYKIKIVLEDYVCMPPDAQAAIDLDTGLLDPIKWSIAEMGAMPYPEPRIELNICQYLASQAVHGPVLAQFSGKPNILTGQRRSQFFSFPPGGGPEHEISADEFNGSP